MSKFRLRGRKRRQRESRPDRIPLRAIVPNLVTSMAACAGITSISLSSEGRFMPALCALLVAVVCDGMDGRIHSCLIGPPRKNGPKPQPQGQNLSGGIRISVS